jgi:hypothetical protein
LKRERTVLVCMRLPERDPRRFTDNVEATCTVCGHGIYHRPRPPVPAGAVKVCVPCAVRELTQQAPNERGNPRPAD